MRGPEWTHGVPTTADELLALQASTISANARRLPGRYGKVRPHEVSKEIVARCDHGRWVGDCGCGSGVAASPEWSLACCFSCGAIYRRIVFPKDRAAIVAALAARPAIENQNWLPGETVAQLLAENAAHGIVEKKGKK